MDLLEYADKQGLSIDLLSDQTSCHAVYEGGYCPVGVTFEERTELLAHHREDFCALVDKTLKRHFEVIKRLVARGTYFFDYGNSFMKFPVTVWTRKMVLYGLLMWKISWGRNYLIMGTVLSAGYV